MAANSVAKHSNSRFRAGSAESGITGVEDGIVSGIPTSSEEEIVELVNFDSNLPEEVFENKDLDLSVTFSTDCSGDEMEFSTSFDISTKKDDGNGC